MANFLCFLILAAFAWQVHGLKLESVKNALHIFSDSKEDEVQRFKCDKDGMYVNPRNCSTFIQCSNGIPHLMPCPSKLHFSNKTQRCESHCDAQCDRSLACKCKWPTCVKEVCFLPPKIGPCKSSIRSFYFDKRQNACIPFIYGGCRGNENNFLTKDDCEELCGNAISDICQLPSKRGPCRGAYPRFFFNPKTRQCEKFFYSGCKGNPNNFENKEKCEQRCLKKPGKAIDICRLPSETGPCKARIERWYYNKITKKCETFTYGGCQGNANNFKTAEECEQRCPQKPAAEKKDVGIHGNCTETRFCIRTCKLRGFKTGLCVGANKRTCQCYNDELKFDDVNQNDCPNETACEDLCIRLGFLSGECVGKDNLQCKCQGIDGGTVDTEEPSSEESSEVKPEPECVSDPDPGNCVGKLIRWYYDKTQGKCFIFGYTGCKGNGNNYQTERECLKHCSKQADEDE